MASTAEEETHLISEDQDQENHDDDYNPRKKSIQPQRRKIVLILIYGGIALLSIFLVAAIFASFHSSSSSPPKKDSCLDLHDGYTCRPSLSQNWGQYSPYYLVPSPILRTKPPHNCRLKSVHLLSRHGARDPTHHKSRKYASLIAKLQSNVPTDSLTGPYAFLANYNYTLGSDQLTSLGRQQMQNLGNNFFAQYGDLARDGDNEVPFIRASGQRRVVESAEKFAAGFHKARASSSSSFEGSKIDDTYPYPILKIPEAKDQNNTLSHDQCPSFNSHKAGKIEQKVFLHTWLRTVRKRLVADLNASFLTSKETIYLMDLCPFDTVASPMGAVSPFCSLFSQAEWIKYDYYQTLGKYYGYGGGSKTGPTLGIGWVNELIARLTDHPVEDTTNTNRTLDGDPATFPFGRKWYADFSHDNDMVSIFAAMGLYKSTPLLDKGRVMSQEELHGFGAASTVPFAGRMVVEAMDCESQGEMVRVIMNGRVLPLEMCGGDAEGRCTLSAFVDGLAFARSGGKWDECFVDGDDGEDPLEEDYA